MIYTLLRKANVFYDLYNMGIELDSASPDGITPLEQHILEQQLISSIGAAASSKSEKSMDPGSVESSGGIMELTAEFVRLAEFASLSLVRWLHFGKSFHCRQSLHWQSF